MELIIMVKKSELTKHIQINYCNISSGYFEKTNDKIIIFFNIEL